MTKTPVPQQWVFANPHRSAPKRVLPDHEAFSTWEKYIGPIVASFGDYEYFVEEAFRLHGAVTAFGEENVWLADYAGEFQDTARNLATGERLSTEALLKDGARQYGARPGVAHGGAIFHSIVDDYGSFGSFRKNAGREISFGGFDTQGDDEINAILTRMHRNGVQAAMLKRRWRKNPLIHVDLSEWHDGASVLDFVDEDSKWALINDSELAEAYLVQEFIPMRYEYRTFIIGQKPVTGAGCFDDFSPLDNDGDAFDSRVREYRFADTPGPLVSRPDIVELLTGFAGRVAKELTAEMPYLDRYVIDTALDGNGDPVVIELNAESNAGFYACQPWLITQALSKLYP